MGFRTELLKSRSVSLLGMNAMEVRHIFRVASERPEQAFANSAPTLPAEGTYLDELDLSYKDADGLLVPVTPGHDLAHDPITIQRSKRLTCQLRNIRTDWYRNSTSDSIVELTYRSGPETLGPGRDNKLRSVIWDQDIGLESITWPFAHERGTPTGTFVLVPSGGIQTQRRTVTMTAHMQGAMITSAMTLAVGTLNLVPFRGFPAGSAMYMGATTSIITGSDATRSGSFADITLTFVGKEYKLFEEEFGGGRLPGYTHIRPFLDPDTGLPIDRVRAYDDPFAGFSVFRELFPTGWNPGAI